MYISQELGEGGGGGVDQVYSYTGQVLAGKPKSTERFFLGQVSPVVC